MVLLAGTTADEMKSRGQGDSHSGEIHIACRVGGGYLHTSYCNQFMHVSRVITPRSWDYIVV